MPSILSETTRSISLRPKRSLLPPSITLGIGAETCLLHPQQYLLLTTYSVTTTLAGTMSSTTLVYESVWSSERTPPHLGHIDWSSSTVASIFAGLALLAPAWPAFLPDFLYRFQRSLPVSAFASMLLATTACTVVFRDSSSCLSSLFSDSSFASCPSSSEHLFLYCSSSLTTASY